jgi:hypothetical protein
VHSPRRYLGLYRQHSNSGLPPPVVAGSQTEQASSVATTLPEPLRHLAVYLQAPLHNRFHPSLPSALLLL